MFDATYTMVTPSTGRRCRPTAFVQSAGMGHVGKWKECIRVDDGEGVPGIAIGHWLKEAKRKGLKRNGGRPLAAKATAASPAGSDALGVAASPDPEASPAGEQQANVQSPASSERATDAEISPNEKAAESQAGVKQTFKHVSSPVGLKVCLIVAEHAVSSLLHLATKVHVAALVTSYWLYALQGPLCTQSMMRALFLNRIQLASQGMLPLSVFMSIHQYVCLYVDSSPHAMSDCLTLHLIQCPAVCPSVCAYMAGSSTGKVSQPYSTNVNTIAYCIVMHCYVLYCNVMHHSVSYQSD